MENNIITATFDGGNLVYVCPRYQYDYGQILKFTDLDLPFAYEVHYSNSDQAGNSVTQIGDENGVIIPDALFLTGDTIYAWVYLHSTEDDGETVYKVVIPVQKRAKPTNATPTPVQQDAITQAIAALDAGVEAAEAAKQAIEDMGVSSTTLSPGSSATVEKEVDPDTGAITLEFGIPEGQQGEQGEQGEPGQDGQDGYSPTVTVEDITGGHRVTVTDANGSHTFDVMDGEQGEQGEPGQDGTDGFSPVVVVTDITGGHQVSITDAQGTQTFDVMDGEVQFSDLYKAFPHDVANGDLVTISDGADNIPVRDLVVNIEPLQAGSGDPSPDNVRSISGWTGSVVYRSNKNLLGGNLLRDTIKRCMPSSVDDATNRTITFSYNATTTSNNLAFILNDKWKENTRYTFIVTASGSTSKLNMKLDYTDGTSVYLPTPSAANTKETIVFTSAANKTVKVLYKSAISGNTTVYYDESGIFEGVFTASDFVPYVGVPNNIGNIFNDSDANWKNGYYLDANGDEGSNERYRYTQNYFEVISSSLYSISLNKTSGQSVGFTLCEYDTSKNFIQRTTLVSATADTGTMIAALYTQRNTKYIRFSCPYLSSAEGSGSKDISIVGNGVQVVFPTEAGTVYGGTLDVTTGKLVVDSAYIELDGSDESWGLDGSGSAKAYFYLKIGANGSVVNNVGICDQYVRASISGSTTTVGFNVFNSSGRNSAVIAVRPSNVADMTLNGFKAMLGDSPIHIVYKLSTSTEYTLLETEVKTLLGLNNIWSDCGDTSLDYRADPTLYIQRLTQPAEDDMTANQNIASGVFFMVGNNLYYSTASIASGEQIVPGTNCTALSLADALNNLNA